MTSGLRVFHDTYVDSVVQLAASRAMNELDGVDWAAAAMATPANLRTLAEEGFSTDELGSANDLFLAVRGRDADAVQAALSAGTDSMFATRGSGGASPVRQAHRTIARAVRELPGTTVAVVSVPGEYAALEAHEALTAGLDVLLFSDNVSIADEVELKDRAARLGRLLMGPGAGTAMLGGVGLGFANVVRPGPVGIVAAAGTGAQEAMSLLDRWGVGISAVIGLGGRDLSDAVDGTMAKAAIASLRADPGTDVIFLVSKPPAERVARAVLSSADGFPLVAALVGGAPDAGAVGGRRPARTPEAGALGGPGRPRTPEAGALGGPGRPRTLEAGALAVLDVLGVQRPDLVSGLEQTVAQAAERLDTKRTLIRGLFSGGTLCYESLVILGDTVGPVYSNVPLDPALRVPAPPGSHVCLDLGEEEYTVGRPHPMIDPGARVEMLDEQARDPAVAVLLLDVVLGYGAHEDPASELAPACERAVRQGAAVVAYVLGTRSDPQGYDRQREILRRAGCIVTETAARASLAAAAVALRDPALVTRAT